MSNPFKKITKNSETTKKQWDTIKEHSTVNTKECHACGAPRPIRSNLVRCAYCGTPFMNINTQIKPDA